MLKFDLGDGMIAVVDDEDASLLGQRKWYSLPARDTTYVITRSGGKTTYLHRLVMGSPVGMEVDHINGNGLDNRRGNLRVVSHRLNIVNQKLSRANTSGFRGVTWNKSRNKWVAQTKVNGKLKGIGYYVTPEEASQAYGRFMTSLYGEHFQTRST